jgi:hypothetical protein
MKQNKKAMTIGLHLFLAGDSHCHHAFLGIDKFPAQVVQAIHKKLHQSSNSHQSYCCQQLSHVTV